MAVKVIEHEECFICGKPVLTDKVIPGVTAIKTCSIKRGDGKHSLLTQDRG